MNGLKTTWMRHWAPFAAGCWIGACAAPAAPAASNDTASVADAAADAKPATDAAAKADAPAVADTAAAADAAPDAVADAAKTDAAADAKPPPPDAVAETAGPKAPCDLPKDYFAILAAGNGQAEATSLRALPGLVAVAGWTTGGTSVGKDGWLAAYDSKGALIWQTASAVAGDDQFNAIAGTTLGFATAGTSKQQGGKSQGTITRFDATGKFLQTYAVGGPGETELYGIVATKDGWLAAGYMESADGSLQLLLQPVDDTNGLGDAKLHGSSDFDVAYALAGLPNGEAAAVGDTADKNGNLHLWLTRFDAKGELLWQRTFADSGEDSGWALRPRLDQAGQLKGLAVAGRRKPAGEAAGYAWLIETDAAGQATWQAKLAAGSSVAYAVMEAVSTGAGGGYAAAGELTANNQTQAALWRTDGKGAVQWAWQGPADSSARAVADDTLQAYWVVGKAKLGGQARALVARVGLDGKSCP